MSSTIDTLRRMANDIARNLASMGHDKAVLATADHIDHFWDPRMKAQIFADDLATLTPIAREAIEFLARGKHPEHQTRATEFNKVDEVGHSDAG
jgi:formate dehydrogenase subunit delta